MPYERYGGHHRDAASLETRLGGPQLAVRAQISIAMYAISAGDAQPAFPSGELVVFRGPRAPAPTLGRALTGEVQEHLLEPVAPGAPGGVTVYQPPGAGGGGVLPPACWPTGSPPPRSRPNWKPRSSPGRVRTKSGITWRPGRWSPAFATRPARERRGWNGPR